VLTFGMAEYQIEFFGDDRATLSYGADSSLSFLTPFGAHAPQGTELMLDYPLTSKSAKSLKKIIGDLKEESHQ
jgi:hypothetical protein